MPIHASQQNTSPEEDSRMGPSHDASHAHEQELARLRQETASLRAEIEDSRETLRAIREGAVDALVIDTTQGQRVFTLQGADMTYRHLVERMREGAVTLTADGTIYFCNRGLADLLKRPLEQVIGTSIYGYVAPADHALLLTMLRKCALEPTRGEIALLGADGAAIPTQVGLAALADDHATASVSMIVIDLSQQKWAERLADSDRQTRRHNAILAGINRIFREALTCQTERELSRVCLNVAQEITQSPIGFLGERNPQTDRMDDLAMGQVSRDLCRMIQPADHGMHLGDDETLPGSFAIRGIFGQVIRDGRSLFTNDPASHPNRVGLPAGHPPLDSFLGVPLVRGSQTIGLIGLGNRPGGYGPEELEAVEALAPAVVQALMSKRAEQTLSSINQRLTSLMQAVPVGVSFSDDITCERISGNPAMLTLMEMEAEDNISASTSDESAPGRQIHFFQNGRPLAGHELPLQRSVAENRPVGPVELEVVLPSGRRWFCEATANPIRDAEGRAVAGLVVSVDVTERKRTEEALRQAKAAAEAASEAKSRFLANISHELRTPMNAILGMIDLALVRQIDPVGRDFLQTAKESADLLLALLNDLLDSAKIEVGKLELESAPFSLRRTLNRTARVLAIRAGEKGIAFACHVAPEAPDVLLGDQVRLRQILLNLAGNGIKFTSRGEVAIDARVASRSAEEVVLEFAVRDTGIGIPRSDLERVFHPFTQADPSTARHFGGTGLGLTICASLVELMGGRIRVDSQPGQGSTFAFTARFPLAKELPPDDETCDLLATATPRRVLLVEDNPANQKLAAHILHERGHTVDIAGDGREALRMTEVQAYDVILMDLQMPGMDGLEATAVLRAREEGRRRVPIIAMTAHAMQSDRNRCLAAGMDGYLAKPIDGRQMITLVEHLAAGPAGAKRDKGESPSSSDAPRAANAPTPMDSDAQTTGFALGDPASINEAPETPLDAAVFDRSIALERCAGSPDVLADMIDCFQDEIESLFPQMETALQKDSLVELGRLAHRLKGTIVYLGAEPACKAALAVERFEREKGTQAEAAAAILALRRHCEALQVALADYRSSTCGAE